MSLQISPRKAVEWQKIREAFVQRSPRPKFDELSTEFSVPEQTIRGCSYDEGWQSLRAQYMDAQLAKADASAVILEACKVDRTLLKKAADIAVAALDALAETIGSINPDNAAGTKASALNTCSFAFKNFAEGLKALGIVGVSRTLDTEGRGENNRWKPETLNQINVVVQGLQAATATATTGPKPSEAAPPASAPVDV